MGEVVYGIDFASGRDNGSLQSAAILILPVIRIERYFDDDAELGGTGSSEGALSMHASSLKPYEDRMALKSDHFKFAARLHEPFQDYPRPDNGGDSA